MSHDKIKSFIIKVCLKVFMHHIRTIFDNNTQICERSAVEIDNRKIAKITSFTHYYFSLRKIHMNENRLLTEIDNGFIKNRIVLIVFTEFAYK